MITPWLRFLNWIGWRNDVLHCIHKDDAWRWSSNLGKQTEGKCSRCDGPIYYEEQNGVFKTKICNRCENPYGG